MPRFMLAMEIRQVLLSAWCLMPTDMMRELADWLTPRVRTYFGLCIHCESTVPTQLTHPPVCEQCDAKCRDEVEAIDKELEGEEE